MRVHRVKPSAALCPYVREILVIASSAGETSVILPEPGLVLGFRIGGPASAVGQPGALATAGITGLRTTLRRMHMPTNGVTVVAAFRPLGAAQFLALPLHEVFGAMVPLAEFVHPADIREVEDHLVAARDARAHAAILDAFLVRRLRAGGEDSLARAAVDRITMAGGNIRIQTLARELGTSVDPLEKRFRRVVGASPKQFASIVRFRRAIAAQGSGRTLAEVAHASGYFDQSHFVREFRAFTGEPPSRFLDTFCGRESHSVLLRGSGRGVVPKVGVRRGPNHNL